MLFLQVAMHLLSARLHCACQQMLTTFSCSALITYIFKFFRVTLLYDCRPPCPIFCSSSSFAMQASEAEAELKELREAAASSGSTIEQWQVAYADLQQQQEAAVAELRQVQEASSSNDSSLEEWRNAYADLQQQCSSLQVTHHCFAGSQSGCLECASTTARRRFIRVICLNHQPRLCLLHLSVARTCSKPCCCNISDPATSRDILPELCVRACMCCTAIGFKSDLILACVLWYRQLREKLRAAFRT